MLDLKDAQNWRENWNSGGAIGFGHANIVKESNYYYMVSEGADMNLACIKGQNWDIGLFRTTNITNTNWEQFPFGNPFIYSSKSEGASFCNPAYVGLFRDPNTQEYYIHFTRRSPNPNYYGIYFYKLVRTDNILKNADLWMCREDNWNSINGLTQQTNYTAYRFTEKSSDGNCYLAANCGQTSCVSSQSIYQDVLISGKGLTNVRFGGNIMSEGGVGKVNVVLYELDSNGAAIAHHALPVETTTSYQPFSRTTSLLPQTHTVRFQMYLLTPQTFRLDEAFVEPIPGGPSPSLTTTPPLLSGDLNLDRIISITDYNLLVTNFGKTGSAGFTSADIDKNGKVDMFDYNVLVGSFGKAQ